MTPEQVLAYGKTHSRVVNRHDELGKKRREQAERGDAYHRVAQPINPDDIIDPEHMPSEWTVPSYKRHWRYG